MSVYRKWKELLTNDEMRNKWIEHYEKSDATLSAVMQFCKHENILSDKSILQLALIAVLDSKLAQFKSFSEAKT